MVKNKSKIEKLQNFTNEFKLFSFVLLKVERISGRPRMVVFENSDKLGQGEGVV